MGETSGVHQPPFLHPDLPIQCVLYTISRISFLKFYSNPITLLFKIWFQWFPLYLVKISLYVYKDCLYKDLNNNHYLGSQIFKLILNMNPGSRQHPPQLTAQKTQVFSHPDILTHLSTHHTSHTHAYAHAHTHTTMLFPALNFCPGRLDSVCCQIHSAPAHAHQCLFPSRSISPIPVTYINPSSLYSNHSPAKSIPKACASRWISPLPSHTILLESRFFQRVGP